MTDTINTQSIVELSQVPGPCVSIHIPIETTGRERMAGKIRLKNLVSVAEGLLAQSGMRATKAKDFMAKASEMDEVWIQPAEGLAVYVAPDFFRAFRLDHAPQERVHVGETFLVRPLLSILSRPDYYILALDQNHTRLLRVRNGQVDRIVVQEMPTSLEEVVGIEYSENQTQWHTAGAISPTHNAGDRGAETKNRLLRFCQAIDRTLTKLFTDNKTTIILAADEPILSIYRGATHLHGVHTEHIEGSPSATKDEDLAEKATHIVDKTREEKLQALAHKFADLAPHDKASDSFEDVSQAVEQGRVGVLLAAKEVTDGDPVTKVDKAIIGTLKQGGLVYELPPEMMPTQNAIAAIYRY